MSEEIKSGQKYKHFKGNEYEIICVARDCENPERQLVIYQSLSGKGQFPQGTRWSRELSDFVGDKTLEGGGKVKRFTLIN